ncbi:poly(rC)-binding protein 2/3/4 [Clonorchis sinensis]|uniref:Poly(RC)-binding protein 2/3/4 n=1 Tax=Clonorchis sinensis TaxID=79923 RepID=G7YBZ1_CLOSI|nr:poly(rC)-binding protein 2/3/4 [Clonorchis sinensis]
MALTSVVPAYIPSQQQPLQATDIQLGSLSGVPPFNSTYQTVSVSHTNPFGFVSSTDANGKLLLASATQTPATLLHSNPMQPGYFSPTTDTTYRFTQPQVHALVNTSYQTFRGSPHPGTPPQFSATISPGCLLPTPSQPNGTTPNSDVVLRLNGLATTKSTLEYNTVDYCGTTTNDESGSVKQSAPISDLPVHPNPQTFVLIVRLLMSGKEVGSIIGKRGENVKKYREESGARINISDGSSPERIVTITGTTEQISVAFTLMSQKFEDDFTQGLLRMATQCGSIIGKGGSRIKEVRELTGASIQVASEALPASTERTVTISGAAKAISKCVRHLCDIFVDSPAKGPVIPYRPKPAFTSQNMTCPGSPFPTGLIHPAMTFSTNGSETTGEHGFPGSPNTCSANLLTATELPTSPPTCSTGQLENGSLQVVTTCPQTFGIPADSNSSLTVIPSGRHSGMVADLLTETIQLPATIGYSEFSSHPIPMLGALCSPHFATGTIHSPTFNPPISPMSFPELTLNPGLIGFYASQPAISGLGTNTTNLIYQGIPNLLRAPNPTSSTSSTTAATAVDEPSTFAQNGTDGSLDSPDIRPCVPNLNDAYTNNSLLSLVQSNAFLHAAVNLPQGPNNHVPFVQNKASLLGLPAFPLPFYVGSQNAAFPLSANLTPAITTTTEEPVTRELIISNELIGCIIGRGGTTVNEIRNISKAQIKISNCEDGAKERKITLSGPMQAVNLAQFLINNSILAHQQMWAFNVQLASAATTLMMTSKEQANGSSPSGEHIIGCLPSKQMSEQDPISSSYTYSLSPKSTKDYEQTLNMANLLVQSQDLQGHTSNGVGNIKSNYKSSNLSSSLKRPRIKYAPY